MAQLRSFVRPAVIVSLGLFLGWLVLAVTIDRVFANRLPEVALRWNPGSSDANVTISDMLLQSSDLTAILPTIAAAADLSLRRQPVNPGAARLLAMVAIANGHSEQGAVLARYAEAMSRRDLPTQVLLIEAAVQRGSVATALVHYDRALKTSSLAPAILFPVLNAAAANPAIWRPLAILLGQRPQWWRPFVDQFVSRSSSPDALFAIARRTGIERGATADPALLQAIEKRLVDLGAFDAAAKLYNRAHDLHPGNVTVPHNGGFEQPGGWDPFEWNLREEPDLSAVRQPSLRSSGGSALFLTAANGRGGDVATQLIILAPGPYVVSATEGGVVGDPLAFPRVVIRCANSSVELLNVPFPTSPDAGSRWKASFVVPTGCQAQRLVIHANSSLDSTNSTPWVDDLVIRQQVN